MSLFLLHDLESIMAEPDEEQQNESIIFSKKLLSCWEDQTFCLEAYVFQTKSLHQMYLCHLAKSEPQYSGRIEFVTTGVASARGRDNKRTVGLWWWGRYNGKPNRKEHNVILPAFIKRHSIPGFQLRRKKTPTPAKNQSIPSSCPFLPLTS